MEQLERIKAYAKDYRRVPIAKEIFADVIQSLSSS